MGKHNRRALARSHPNRHFNKLSRAVRGDCSGTARLFKSAALYFIHSPYSMYLRRSLPIDISGKCFTTYSAFTRTSMGSPPASLPSA